MTHALSIAVALFIFGWAWFVTVESLVSIGCHKDEDQIELELLGSPEGTIDVHAAL